MENSLRDALPIWTTAWQDIIQVKFRQLKRLPLILLIYIVFSEKQKAYDFEKYLISGSGQALAQAPCKSSVFQECVRNFAGQNSPNQATVFSEPVAFGCFRKYLYPQMTILLVDDDEDDQDIFKEAVCLINPNIKCLLAKDGEDGLAQLETVNPLPDYVFLDVNMPRMDGREFLKRVKGDARLAKIPVVIYSTSNHKHELGEYFRMGASNFITKPSEFNLLITYLKSILS